MHILLATSFHEHLEALAGFHLNWRAAFSGRMTTLAHLSANTRATMLADIADLGILPTAAELLINPFSIPTCFGSALPMMIHNHRIATRIGVPATHIYLASPYLYAFHQGLDDEVEQFDCGLPATTWPLHRSWLWHDAAAADTRLQALARHLNVTLKIGRADGVYIPRSLFDDMLALLHRFYSPDEIAALDPIYPLEEVIFPTILPALLGPNARIGSTRARVWEPGDEPTNSKLRSAITSGLYASGKRIPQIRRHPLRQTVLANLPGPLVLNTNLGTTDA